MQVEVVGLIKDSCSATRWLYQAQRRVTQLIGRVVDLRVFKKKPKMQRLPHACALTSS